MNERIAVITGAAPIPEHVVATIADSTIILGVDGGLDQALAAGLHPSGLIGDLDSISNEGLAWAEEHATISRHPTAKDQTDTELALIFAAEMIPSGITLIGGGNRLDHTFAAIGALGMSELTTVPHIDAWWDGQHIDVVHGPSRCTLQVKPGSTMSLLALHGRCEKVSINGVRWELQDAQLESACGTGISNEVLDDPTIEIQLSKGVLTIFDDPILSNDHKNLQDTPS